ncbi:MAG TPA: hypothetical protein VHZ26_08970 [Caulobacteraceae bacterium]|jgi:hypothetical protein|nr:hypothetical protein [Caulobacteraceae bacterium]
MMLSRLAGVIAVLGLLSGCANHPVDCTVGIHHSDCAPGTPGYDNPDKFAVADDQECRSYGLTPGTSQYADCRVKLNAAHQAPAGLLQ